jgi:hypothetical protein
MINGRAQGGNARRSTTKQQSNCFKRNSCGQQRNPRGDARKCGSERLSLKVLIEFNAFNR